MKIDDTRQGTVAQSNRKREQTSPFALGVLGLAERGGEGAAFADWPQLYILIG